MLLGGAAFGEKKEPAPARAETTIPDSSILIFSEFQFNTFIQITPNLRASLPHINREVKKKR